MITILASVYRFIYSNSRLFNRVLTTMFSSSLKPNRLKRSLPYLMMTTIMLGAGMGYADPKGSTVLPKSVSHCAKSCSPSEQANNREDRMIREMFEKLQLSSKQQATILALMASSRQKNHALFLKADRNRATMVTYLKSKNATFAGAQTKSGDFQKIMHELAIQRLTTWFQIRKELTPQQLENLNQIKM
jgi:Spy/CpxP family protein refolding chaperone